MTTELDGATTVPADYAACSDIGEFAALWNSWDVQQRENALQSMHSSGATAVTCFIEDHKTQIRVLQQSLADREQRIRDLDWLLRLRQQ